MFGYMVFVVVLGNDVVLIFGDVIGNDYVVFVCFEWNSGFD